MNSALSHPDSLQDKMIVAIAHALFAESAAQGYRSPLPHAFIDSMVERAASDMKALPRDKLASLALTDAGLLQVTSASFNSVIGRFSEPQQRALKQGLNPYDPTVLEAPGSLHKLLRGEEVESPETRSSRRFFALRDADDGRYNQFAGLGLSRSDMATLAESGLSRGALAGFLDQGLTMSQILSGAGFAGALGVSANSYTGKFGRLSQTQQTDVRTLLDQIKSDPSLSEEEKRKRIAQFRKDNPEIGNVLSEQDFINIANERAKEEARKDITAARNTETDNAKRSVEATIGAEQAEQLQAQEKTAATARTTDTAADDLADALGMGVGNAPSARETTVAAAQEAERPKKPATLPRPPTAQI